MSKTTRPPFNAPRGKYYLASWILKYLPPDSETRTYLEPFAGGISVLLNKPPSHSEAINDLDLGIVQIFRALRDESGSFIGRLKRTKYCQKTFDRVKAADKYKDYMDHAVRELVCRRLSRGGLKQTFAPEGENAWHTILDEMPKIAARLSKINIFNKSAVEVIKAFDDEDFLCYCDPPDSMDSQGEYSMDIDDHIALAEALNSYRGKVIVTAPICKLYRRLYGEWKCARTTVSGRKMIYLWTNYYSNCSLMRAVYISHE